MNIFIVLKDPDPPPDPGGRNRTDPTGSGP